MKAILEIPVFTSLEEHFKTFVSSSSKVSEKKYSGFNIYDFELDDAHSVWFYVLDEVPVGNDFHVDQIIPRAPFSLLMINQGEGFAGSHSGDMFLQITKEYLTPLFVMVSTTEESFHSKLATDELFVKHEPSIILFDETSPNAINATLLEAIKLVSKRKPVEE